MPRFTQDDAASGPLVTGFADGQFIVSGGIVRSVLMTPDWAEEWMPPPLDMLDASHVSPLLALQPPPEFLILGTGPAMAFPPRAFVKALEAQGIGVEAMDSKAAARTWGMLRGEGRWIAAALMPL
ncbi:Mth938-like domain-containing protein [Allosphingosinicella flava]|uniref:Mth938-like domain-containing protein n=1 Tax=Allosphingosinicella flava TaxID=2771430 RepID=A0A7T2GHX4_9SPHN|nr:Mth938-like domain-containing protein [Sphingosinicella flava]QPQ54169.1 Mth938-like domain-containing protein [Sphingosinicella flava]